jgi:hypothetical protein
MGAADDDQDDPYRAIRIGDPGLSGETNRWGVLLTRFMRVLSAFWLLQGLLQWRVVLMGDVSLFDALPKSAAFAIIFFAVLDLVAAVGLWLATPWGGVLWLLIASAQIFVASSMPRFFAGGYFLTGVDFVLITLYFVLTFEAGRDSDGPGASERRRRQQKRAAARLAAPAARTRLQSGVASLRGLLSRGGSRQE